MKIKGSGIYTDTHGKSHNILGFGEMEDSENFRKIEVSGSLSFEKISCEKVSVSGKCEGNSITAKSLEVSGEMSIKNIFGKEVEISGRCKGDSINAKNFSTSGKIEYNSLTIEQTLRISGKPQINFVTADEILIATNNGFLGEVKCRKIRIFDDLERFAEEFFGKIFIEDFSFNKSHSRVQIKNIRAESVDLENCEVDVIRCKDALIGSNCMIEKLFVTGKCEIAADSKVTEIIRT